MQNVKENLEWTTVAWTNVSMRVIMQFDLTLKYFKAAFTDIKVFIGLPTTLTGGWVGEWMGGGFS